MSLLLPILSLITGKHGDVPPFPFAKIREKFQFLSLLTSPEAISVMELLRMECGRVGEMSLFHTGASKHLKLEEFDSAQQQASVQVYSKCICSHIILIAHLKQLGRTSQNL